MRKSDRTALAQVGLKLLYAYISTGCVLNAATGIGDSDRIPAKFLPLYASYNQTTGAGLDEDLLSLSFSNLLYMENLHSYKKCQ